MKIRRIIPLVAPMDIRMAMSCVFSMTSMTSVVTMEKEPMRTTIASRMNMPIFSSFNAAKRLAFMSIHVRTEASGPSSFWRAAATVSALYTSLTVTSMPEI